MGAPSWSNNHHDWSLISLNERMQLMTGLTVKKKKKISKLMETPRNRAGESASRGKGLRGWRTRRAPEKHRTAPARSAPALSWQVELECGGHTGGPRALREERLTDGFPASRVPPLSLPPRDTSHLHPADSLTRHSPQAVAHRMPFQGLPR